MKPQNKKIVKVAFYLAHPAHYHYFKNTVKQLRADGHKPYWLVKNKDILRTLLDNENETYTLIGNNKAKGKLKKVLIGIISDLNVIRFLNKNNIDYIIGSMFTFNIRLLTNTYPINCGEDDAAVLDIYPKLVYPFAREILSPTCCDNGKWNNKSTKFNSYMKIGYLHPNNFTPSKSICERCKVDVNTPYFIIRFSSLNAHHDDGIQGINAEVAQRLIDILKLHGDIYITSERELEPQFEQYRIKINPLDMHHVMAFASLYIGDSQTMAAEAGILGVPFIRFNGFVGRIGYLDELETKYELGYGIQSDEKRECPYEVRYRGKDDMYKIVESLVQKLPRLKSEWNKKRNKLLSEKIDYAKFLTWFIENYPTSKDESMKGGNEFWERFR